MFIYPTTQFILPRPTGNCSGNIANCVYMQCVYGYMQCVYGSRSTVKQNESTVKQNEKIFMCIVLKYVYIWATIG